MPVPFRDWIINMNPIFGTSGAFQVTLAVWMEKMFEYVILIMLVPCTTNYKQYFSIVLQGLAITNCKFIAIDVCALGRQSNGVPGKW